MAETHGGTRPDPSVHHSANDSIAIQGAGLWIFEVRLGVIPRDGSLLLRAKSVAVVETRGGLIS